MNRKFFVYIVRCRDGSLYIGVTNRLAARMRRHNEYQGAEWVKQRGGGRVVYAETCDSYAQAYRREKQLKKWSRAKKEALIQGDRELLKTL